MYKLKITKTETQVYNLIKEWEFFDFTYAEIAKMIGVKRPQCVVNQLRALERKWMIEIVKYEKRLKGKMFKEFICHDYPKIEIVFNS